METQDLFLLSAVNMIQAMLAPAIMISACGLLLLGMNNKYSIVVSRIRLLNEERRRLTCEPKKGHLSVDEQFRLQNIINQIHLLKHRILIVRNAVLSYSIAVALFIVASLLIGFNVVSTLKYFSIAALIVFLLGMLSVLAGVIFAAREVYEGYKIVNIEVIET